MRFLTAYLLLVLCSSATADLVTHVIDGGPGLATVTRFPNDQIMVFDTGHWDFDDPTKIQIPPEWKNKIFDENARKVYKRLPPRRNQK